MEKDREYEKEGGKEGRERVEISGEEGKKKREDVSDAEDLVIWSTIVEMLE